MPEKILQMPGDLEDEKPTATPTPDQLYYLRVVERSRDEIVELAAHFRRIHVQLDRRVRHLRELWGLPGRVDP